MSLNVHTLAKWIRFQLLYETTRLFCNFFFPIIINSSNSKKYEFHLQFYSLVCVEHVNLIFHGGFPRKRGFNDKVSCFTTKNISIDDPISKGQHQNINWYRGITFALYFPQFYQNLPHLPCVGGEVTALA
jgi:hypothetical protein